MESLFIQYSPGNILLMKFMSQAKDMFVTEAKNKKGFRFDHVWETIEDYEKFKCIKTKKTRASQLPFENYDSSQSDNPTQKIPNREWNGEKSLPTWNPHPRKNLHENLHGNPQWEMKWVKRFTHGDSPYPWGFDEYKDGYENSSPDGYVSYFVNPDNLSDPYHIGSHPNYYGGSIRIATRRTRALMRSAARVVIHQGRNPFGDYIYRKNEVNNTFTNAKLNEI
ncbi:hypothetical protein Syun_030244 [Stephania yunnanensis]|uniref:Uncharacterized protein n=1 Tax=Stephania yunnanensis TaxID=152371 RepID=A0AAP0E6Y5_9MAGN